MMRPLLLAVLALTACAEGGSGNPDRKDNVAPTAPEISLRPLGPDTRDDLEASLVFEATDDNDDPLTYEYAWLVDGDLRADLTGDTVSSSETEKGQQWEVRVRAYDGLAYSESAQDSVEIGNADPTITISWVNPTPNTDDDLVVDAQADDPDEDLVTLAYTWTVDGGVTPFTTETVPADATTRGEVWMVEVVATDEDDDSASEQLEVTVANRAPVITDLTVTPNPAPASATLTVGGQISDPDGDVVSVTYAWTRNGSPSSVVVPSVPPALTEDGDTWTVTVTADDLHGGVTQAVASALVVNHAPTFSSIELWPSPAGDSDTLFAFVNDEEDADGDAIDESFSWTRNGVTYPSTDSFIPSNVTQIGDVWQVAVTLTDGTAVVGPNLSNVVTIEDQPPSAPSATLDPLTPDPCHPLTCVVTADSYDPDGTAVVQSIHWRRNNVAFGGPFASTWNTDDTVLASDLSPGDTWTCTVTATSGGLSAVPAVVSATVLDTSATETFTTHARTQADILLMVDNSGSMGPYQVLFGDASATLIDELDAIGLDYHIAVVTSDMDDPLQAGNMVVNAAASVNAIPSMVDRKAILADMVNRDIYGSPTEMGLATTYAALTPPLSTAANAAFYRASGALAVLFLSDEDDQSASPTPSAYTALLGTKRPASDLVLWGIVGNQTDGCTGPNGYASPGDRYVEAIAGLHGTWTSICDTSYVDSVRDFADAVAGVSRRLQLHQIADPITLSVVQISVGGAHTALSQGLHYTYDASTNSLLLAARPSAGTGFEVSYSVECATP